MSSLVRVHVDDNDNFGDGLHDAYNLCISGDDTGDDTGKRETVL